MAQAKLAEMEATKQIDPVKKAELEASIKIAQARLVEAEAVGKNTAVLREQLNILTSSTAANNSMAASTSAVGTAANRTADAIDLLNTKYQQSSSYTSQQIALLNEELGKREALMDLKQREIDLENRRRGVDKEGYTLNTAGQRAVGSAMSLNEAVKQAVAQGLSEEEAITIAKRNYEPGGRKWFGTASIDVAGGVYGNTFWEQVNESLDKQLLNKGIGGQQAAARQTATTQAATTTQATAPRQSPATTQAATPATQAQQSAGAAKTYNVTFGGRTVKTASDADAQALMQMLNDARLSA